MVAKNKEQNESFFTVFASGCSGVMKVPSVVDTPTSKKMKKKKKVEDENMKKLTDDMLTDEEREAIAKKVNKNKNMKANSSGLFEILGAKKLDKENKK